MTMLFEMCEIKRESSFTFKRNFSQVFEILNVTDGITV